MLGQPTKKPKDTHNPAGIPSSLREPFQAVVAKFANKGWRLRDKPTGRLWRFKIPTGHHVAPRDLVNRWWLFEALGKEGSTLIVRPVKPIRVSHGRQLRKKGQEQHRRLKRLKVKLPAHLRGTPTDIDASAREQLKPPPVGVSKLEKLKDSADVVRTISFLAQEKDDPFAWRDLACGYRCIRLRKPIEDALRDVGVEKVLWLIRQIPADWPPEVLEFLRTEMGILERKRLGPSVSMERPAWETYSQSDVG